MPGRLRLVSLALAGLTASSCSSGGGAPPRSPSPPAASVAAPSLPGTLLVLAGASPDSADVYRLQLSPVRFARLTTSPTSLGVSWLTAGCCRVFVSDARDGAMDHVEQLTARGYRTIPGLTDGEMAHPELQDDRSFAYMWVERGSDTKPDITHISSFDLTTHSTRDLVASVHDIWNYSIRADGVLAFAERSLDEEKGTVVIHTLDGHTTPVSGYSDDPVLLSWGGPGGELAIGNIQHRATTLVAVDGKVSAQLKGWTALTWAPQGADMLLVTNGPQLATWVPGAATPKVVGDLTGGGTFYAATWTATDPLRKQS